MADITASILAPIFSLFNNLMDLDFTQHDSNWFYARFPSADPSLTSFFSVSIVRLLANVRTLDDFLYLLDGRLPGLQRLTIYIARIDHSDVVADTKVCTEIIAVSIGRTSTILFWKILANLKSLSFNSLRRVQVYDSQIHPLLRQMTGLEELSLRLYVFDRPTAIDSTYLNQDILPYLPHLQTFHFDIHTCTSSLSEVLEHPIKETQHVFYNGRCHPLVNCTDRLRYLSACSHIFSLPFAFDRMEFITSNFPGGLFSNVRHLVLFDIYYPFIYLLFRNNWRPFAVLTVQKQCPKGPVFTIHLNMASSFRLLLAFLCSLVYRSRAISHR